MRSPALPSPRHLAAALGLAVLAAGLAPIAASANTDGSALVISEVYGGGGNSGATLKNDFIELYNPTSSAIGVATMSVQYRSGTGTGTGFTNLTGSVPAHGHYLIQEAAGAGGTDDLPTPDVTGGLNMSGTAGAVALVTGTGVQTPDATNTIDLVGYGTASLREGTAAPAPSNTTSVSRNAAGKDSDNNAADFTVVTPAPENSSVINNPGGVTVQSAGAQSGTVGQPITPFTITASGGTAPYTYTATGLPDGVTISTGGTVSGTPTTAGTTSVTVTATDAAAATGQTTFPFSVNAPAGTVTPIADIQGTGATSPLVGQTVTTQGVVTASYPTGGLNGFYIQTPGADTTDASDAIFVYGGAGGFATYPQVGDSVQVTGDAAEFSGATQLVSSNGGVTVLGTSLGTVTPKASIPGTDCALPGTDCLSGAALDQAREVAEGELFQPTNAWTATDVYDGGPYYNDGSNSGSFRGELGVVANSTKPLVAPTEVIDAQATAQVAERKRYNDAHRIILDDASSLTYSTSQNSDKPFPWFTQDHTVRVGAAITFPKPVVFTYGFNAWRILPQAQVTGDSTGTIDFAQTRPAKPENVGGDVKLATFNVLNFFPTTGEEFVASGGTCSYYNDRAGNPITDNTCNPNGPRGAATTASLTRQRDKIVSAINTANADIVSLEELENSAKFAKNRDDAIGKLVDALNVGNAGKWAFVPSPTGADLPALADEDVIRTGFVYQPANVALVGTSKILVGSAPFGNAREPLAQAFKRVGTPDANAFAVIVNHFKSKGSGVDDGTGQGNANPDRVNQANALVAFANQFKTDRGISRVFLAGDFNAYSEEDPIQVLEAAGYTSLDSSSNPDEETYNFDGQVGSLDHVLANGPALADVNGVDVWDINGYESVYYEYSRFNSNVTDLYAVNPFRSSDHSPEIVGINTGAPVVPPAPDAVDTTVIGVAAPVQYGKAGSVAVAVAPPKATGTVKVMSGGTIIGSTTLTSGTGRVALPATSLPVGTHTLTLTYSGDAGHKPSTGSVSVVVTKADATVATRLKPKKIVVKKTRAKVVVRVGAEGFTPTGTVKVRVGGHTYRVSLTNGKAIVRLKKFDTRRAYRAKVAYLGDANSEVARTTLRIKVRRR